MEEVKEIGIEKPTRSKDEIQKEYAATCTQAGELAFKAEYYKIRAQQIYQKMNDLNAEASQLNQEKQDGQTQSN